MRLPFRSSIERSGEAEVHDKMHSKRAEAKFMVAFYGNLIPVTCMHATKRGDRLGYE